jgi:hypothetical protein
MHTDSILKQISEIRGLVGLKLDLEMKTFDDLPTILALIELGDKWDVPIFRKIIRQELRGRLHEKYERTASLFIVATKLHDIRVMVHLTSQYEGEWEKKSFQNVKPYESQNPNTLHAAPGLQFYGAPSISGSSSNGPNLATTLFQLEICGYQDFLQIPPSVVWAMLRSTGPRSRDINGLIKVETASKQFGDILNELCEYIYTAHH